MHANYTQSIYNLNIIPEIQNFLGTPTEIFDEEFGSISKGISSTYNTNISLNALPSARFEFLYWKDEEGQIISVQQDLQHTLVKSENIYGVFKEKEVEVNLANRPQSGGDIYINNVSTKTTSLNVLPFGVTQNFTPKPSNGYSFVHWEINNQISENQNIQFNGLDTLQLTAVYEPLPYPLEVIVYPEGSGQVLTQSSKNSFLNDSLVELTAVPSQGYKFSYWSGEVSQSINPKTSLIMKEGRKIYAYFAEATVNANVNIKSLSPEGDFLEKVEGGYVNIADSYRIGMQPTISAVAFDGFEFSHWEDSAEKYFLNLKNYNTRKAY